MDEGLPWCSYQCGNDCRGHFEKQQENKQVLFNELMEINKWFIEYDNQVKQYERCLRLGVEFDKDINELDKQAKTNQERIREIRNLLN